MFLVFVGSPTDDLDDVDVAISDIPSEPTFKFIIDDACCYFYPRNGSTQNDVLISAVPRTPMEV